MEGAGVILAVEVAVLPAPVRPGAGEAVEDLGRAALAAGVVGALGGLGAPEPLRHALLLDGDEVGGDAGLAEVLLRHDVDGDLRPVRGHADAGRLEDGRPVGVDDARVPGREGDSFERILTRGGEVSFDAHSLLPRLGRNRGRRQYASRAPKSLGPKNHRGQVRVGTEHLHERVSVKGG